MIGGMTATVTIKKGGAFVVPRAMREKLKLREGSRLKVQCDDASLSCVPEEDVTDPPLQIKRMPNGRRVIMGWDGFDAAKAVTEAREAHIQRLLGESSGQ
jgi:bifunctional DNA-binding transcriptional regulator/antitoxin component of YhaV-PrlF toxin-antitoxin module